MFHRRILILASLVFAVSIACSVFSGLSTSPTATLEPTPTSTATLLPAIPIEPGAANPNEPVLITGEIPYTSPFFVNSIKQPFVLLEDQAGFVNRDREFYFPLAGQVIGPVEINDEEKLTYQLALPSVPQGKLVDVDNDVENDIGVQVFAVAYWSNVWGGPFLEEREGKGWSNAYSSTLTDPDNDDEITGGTLIVWAPDDQQSFPSGFGEDGLLFSEDDPITPIPAGYNLVDLNNEPFHIYKEAQPNVILNEGAVEVNDYSDMSFEEAFRTMFEKASREYPFTEEKDVDWQALYDKYMPRIQEADNSEDFYNALREFSYEIPDGHINVSLNPDVFYELAGGGFGLVLTELSDDRIIVTYLLPGSVAEKAGIDVGAEIISWDSQPVEQGIGQVTPYFGPFSTEHALRVEQVNYVSRVSPGTRIKISYKNPEDSQVKEVTLKSEVEYESLFETIPELNRDELSLPIEGFVLDDSGLGYVRITTFSEDYNMMARLWEHYIQGLIDQEVPGLIIDLRSNGGGSTSMTSDFLGYFFDEEIPIYRRFYYSDISGEFEEVDRPAKIVPAPLLYEGEIAVLVSPNCVSACEGFAYTLQENDRAIVLGHFPSAGAFGDVGRGQYTLPDEITMQYPTGRPESPSGEVIIEGKGIIPDLIVPVTEESALGGEDALLIRAIESLLDKIK